MESFTEIMLPYEAYLGCACVVDHVQQIGVSNGYLSGMPLFCHIPIRSESESNTQKYIHTKGRWRVGTLFACRRYV